MSNRTGSQKAAKALQRIAEEEFAAVGGVDARPTLALCTRLVHEAAEAAAASGAEREPRQVFAARVFEAHREELLRSALAQREAIGPMKPLRKPDDDA